MSYQMINTPTIITAPANFIGMKIWQCFAGLPQQSWFYTDDERIAVTNQG